MILTVSICVRLQVGSCCLELNPWVTSLGLKWGKPCRACSKQFCWCLQVRGRLSSTVLSLSQINKTGKPCEGWSKSAWKELRTGAERAPTRRSPHQANLFLGSRSRCAAVSHSGSRVSQPDRPASTRPARLVTPEPADPPTPHLTHHRREERQNHAIKYYFN